MITVYFDTSFFIDLARAEDDAAVAVALQRLNDLGVRYVVSPIHVHELLAHPDSPERIARLLWWLGKLHSGPFCIDNATLHVLAAPLDQRIEMACFLAHHDTAMAKGDAIANSARNRSLSLADLESAHPETSAAFGLNNGQVDLAQAFECFRNLLDGQGISVPDDMLADPTQAAESVMAAIRAKHGSDKIDQLLDEQRAVDSAIKGESRSKDVALLRATDRGTRRFVGAVNDGRHMAVFVRHPTDIDLFQMDGRQLRKMAGAADHQLRAQGLADRCFTASDLLETVKAVEAFAARKAP